MPPARVLPFFAEGDLRLFHDFVQLFVADGALAPGAVILLEDREHRVSFVVVVQLLHDEGPTFAYGLFSYDFANTTSSILIFMLRPMALYWLPMPPSLHWPG